MQLKSRYELDDPNAVVTNAAHVLRSFPDNFHKLLWTIGERHVPKRCGGGVKSQFGDIYHDIFTLRAGDALETRDFLASAFLDFVINQWHRDVIAPSLLQRVQKSIPKRFVTRAEFGARYGLTRGQVARVLATKSIRTIKIPMGATNQLLIDLHQLHEPVVVPGKVFGLRPAATAIGVSAKALRSLQVSGHFRVKNVVRHDSYHEHDIQQFIERLLALNRDPMTRTLPRDCITLHQAMHRDKGKGGGGASVIRALLSGELRVLGNVDGKVGGLFVSLADFQQFGKDNRARQNGNARTPLEVAKEIHCNQACVPGLVERRLLDGWNTPAGLRISEASIANFTKKYVSLVSLAREIGSSVRDLKGYCAAKHIPMILVKYRYAEIKHAFVHLRDRNAVLSYRPMWNQQRSAERKRRLAAKEQQRLRVLREVNQGHITKKQAALELGICVGHVYRLLAQWRAGHDNPLRHRQRGTTGTTVEPQNAGSGETASRGIISGEEAGEAVA